MKVTIGYRISLNTCLYKKKQYCVYYDIYTRHPSNVVWSRGGDGRVWGLGFCGGLGYSNGRIVGGMVTMYVGPCRNLCGEIYFHNIWRECNLTIGRHEQHHERIISVGVPGIFFIVQPASQSPGLCALVLLDNIIMYVLPRYMYSILLSDSCGLYQTTRRLEEKMRGEKNWIVLSV